MANALWERLARVFRRSTGVERKAAERILLEADFGVDATEAILAEVSRAADGDFRAGLERAVVATLGTPALGVDPGALAARARNADTVLVDTAGRLHTDERLREELKKVVRVVGKRQAGAPHESLLVLDATVGQNAVRQAEVFAAAVPLTGLIITKLDGTAKGGSVVALRRAVPVPIRFLATGETLDDLEPFDPVTFAHRLVSG